MDVDTLAVTVTLGHNKIVGTAPVISRCSPQQSDDVTSHMVNLIYYSHKVFLFEHMYCLKIVNQTITNVHLFSFNFFIYKFFITFCCCLEYHHAVLDLQFW